MSTYIKTLPQTEEDFDALTMAQEIARLMMLPESQFHEDNETRADKIKDLKEKYYQFIKDYWSKV